MSQLFGQDCVIELLGRNSGNSSRSDNREGANVVWIPSAIQQWKTATFARGAFGEISIALFRTTTTTTATTIDSRHGTMHPDKNDINLNNRQHKNGNTNTLQFVAVKTIAVSPEEQQRNTANKNETTYCNEVEILRRLQPHSNIISLLAVYPSSNGNEIKMVSEYCPVDLHMSLEWRRRRRRKNAIVQQPLSLSTIQCIMYDLCSALQYMHTNNDLVHNDLKPGNILVSSQGYMKLCDFGLTQTITTASIDTPTTEVSGPNRSQRHRTKGMTTLNYRSPEAILGSVSLLPSVDMYAAGVILAELLRLPSSSTTLFHGTTEMEQLQQICHKLGTPHSNHWPEYQSLPYGQHFTFQQIYPPQDVTEYIPRCAEYDECTNDDRSGTDLLRHILVLDPKLRSTSSEAVQHKWFYHMKQDELEPQRRWLVQEELIPPELIEPILISGSENNPDNSDHQHYSVISKSEQESILLAKIQGLELSAKRRSFLTDLDCWI